MKTTAPSEPPLGPNNPPPPRPARRRRYAVALCIILAVLLAAAVAANVWIRVAARPHLHDALEGVPARDAVIVPGASVFADGTPSGALEDRLRAALEVFRSGRAQRILVSGVDEGRGYDEVGGMERWLRAAGVPADAILEDRGGVRTLDTMERARRVFGITGAIVCTQGFHLPRAVFLARRAGIDAVGLRADKRVYRDAFQDELREFFARIKALLDTYILRTEPEHGADPPPRGGSTR
ncbi:MAG: YdcF family protein [Deltaproteobacteria bacterium]|nr:YdcF family protein [Deltaproteobacteria bacterium]